MNTAVIVRVAPEATAPSAHGNAATQSPAFDTNVSPAGVTSATDTAAASDGPAFVTVIVYVTLFPATTVVVPVFVIDTSADADTVVSAEALLLPGVASAVVEDTVAVFVKGLAPE